MDNNRENTKTTTCEWEKERERAARERHLSFQAK